MSTWEALTNEYVCLCGSQVWCQPVARQLGRFIRATQTMHRLSSPRHATVSCARSDMLGTTAEECDTLKTYVCHQGPSTGMRKRHPRAANASTRAPRGRPDVVRARRPRDAPRALRSQPPQARNPSPPDAHQERAAALDHTLSLHPPFVRSPVLQSYPPERPAPPTAPGSTSPCLPSVPHCVHPSPHSMRMRWQLLKCSFKGNRSLRGTSARKGQTFKANALRRACGGGKAIGNRRNPLSCSPFLPLPSSPSPLLSFSPPLLLSVSQPLHIADELALAPRDQDRVPQVRDRKGFRIGYHHRCSPNLGCLT